MVGKPAMGSFGNRVRLVESREDVVGYCNDTRREVSMFQEFVPSSRGRDVRVFVVGGKAQAAMLRTSTNPEEFRANIAVGGAGTNFDLNDQWASVAESAADIIGLDFCGVDLLFSEDGSPLVCEVNPNPHFVGLESSCGIRVPDLIFDHIARTVGDVTVF